MQDEFDIIEALRRGERASALDMARAAAAAAPDDPQVYRVLALALTMNGANDAAHAALDRAIALAPEDSSLHYQRASLLVAENRSDEAGAELERSINTNPNELRAYVMQAQIALGRGDIDEADRLVRLAARVNPDHPWLLTVQGMVLLHRRQLEQAHTLLARAAKLAPDDIQTRYGLGLSFFAQGHMAFAEQAFRGVVEKNPEALGMRFLLADAIRRQQRFADAADVLEAGFGENATIPPDMLRFAGELRLVANDHVRALPLLRRAVAAAPEDRAALDGLIEALRRQGDVADARHTLETALANTPHIAGLWSALLSFEPIDGDTGGIADRWQQAIPGAVEPLHIHMWRAAKNGDDAAATALAYRIIEREPGHAAAQIHLISHLYQNNPQAAVDHISSLLPKIQNPDTLRQMLDWLARSQDRSGLYADAVATWTRIHTEIMKSTMPLPASSRIEAPYPALAQASADAPRPVFLYGPPGSGVERVVGVLAHNTPGMLMDRPTGTPPNDLLQRTDTIDGIASGALDAESVVSSWRAALPMREVQEADAIDWLLGWDNALLRALRPQLPGALLVLVVVDPRDMLLDWLLKGTYAGLVIESPTAIAAWMAGVLDHIATLVEDDLFPHRLLRLDDVVDDAEALASAVGAALSREMQAPPSLGPDRHLPGHWREYAKALAEPFALLAPVARRLGYPDT